MSKRTTIKKKEKKDKREEKRREAVKYEEKIAVGCRWHTGIFMRGIFILIYIKHIFKCGKKTTTTYFLSTTYM